ncbi:MAG: LysR family transcriptional regulator [Phormidesmis sp. RL_2_1]|nr:LysR family transcriptional regulator [Phormidesmis sp. RL_2_1]
MVVGTLPQINLKVRHLQMFLTVVEEMNFSRAAERLHMAQPPLSRQIQRLESSLGVQLFDRSSAHIRLTEAGKIFSERASVIVTQVNQSIQLTQMVAKGLAGQLILGIDSTIPSCDQALVLIKAYRENYPEIEVEIHELSAQAQLTALSNEEIDIGFANPQSVPDEVSTQIIVQEPLVAALPIGHYLTQQTQLRLIEIASEPLIMDETRTKTLFTSAQFIPRVVQHASDSRLMLSFVASGMGIAILPASAQHHSSRTDLVYRAIEPSINVISLSALWRRQELKTTVTSFLNVLKSEYANKTRQQDKVSVLR